MSNKIHSQKPKVYLCTKFSWRIHMCFVTSAQNQLWLALFVTHVFLRNGVSSLQPATDHANYALHRKTAGSIVQEKLQKLAVFSHTNLSSTLTKAPDTSENQGRVLVPNRLHESDVPKNWTKNGSLAFVVGGSSQYM